MDKLSKARLVAAHNERSLIDNGYLYVGRFEMNGTYIVAYRNPMTSKRAKVTWNRRVVCLYIDGKLVNSDPIK